MSSDPRDPGYSFEAKNAEPVTSEPQLPDSAFEATNFDDQPKEAQMPDPMMAKLDKLLGVLTSLDRRMDALEAGQSNRARADSSRKAREAEMRQAIEVRQIRKIAEVVAAQQNAMDKRTRPNTPKEIDENVAIMGRFDSVFSHVGRRPPEPLRTERPAEYHRRVLADIAGYASEDLRKCDFYAVADSVALTALENQIVGNVMANPNAILRDAKPGELIRRDRIDPYTGGRTITYHGHNTFIMGMKPASYRLREFRKGMGEGHGKFFRNFKANPPDQPV